MKLRIGTTAGLQIGFSVLLAVCLAQTAWWVLDTMLFASSVRDRLTATFQSDLLQADGLLRARAAPAEVARLFPHLEIASPSVRVRPGISEALEEERSRRVRRYWWEGGFFIAVLAASVVVLTRSLRQRARLHRRQENFVAAVGHELKSPLASIRLSAETLSMRDPPPERREKLVRRILEDVERLER